MKKQIFNPFLPLTEYIPDGEPHVFGDRVYIYGSHDAAGSSRFCVEDYTVYSASIDDLTTWKHHGVTYRKDQDPRAKEGKLPDYYAPDCVRGNDGRYYLYYCPTGPNLTPFGPISVAVGDTPAGPFNYLGDVQYKDGTVMKKYLTNDPALINDNGKIYMYYGWSINRDFRSKFFRPLYNFVQSKLYKRSLKEVRTTKPSIMGCACVELEDDMLTVKQPPHIVLDSVTTAPKNSEYYDHAFYEAPSIRKFDDLYYLVYSSGKNNELAYATSKYPDRDFVYRGVIISNADLGYKGNNKPKAPAGTIHGGIELVNGQYYVVYHRCTHNTDFSRQACAEPIEINKDGTIAQVEMTTQGLNMEPLMAKGSYPAAICCNLYGNYKHKLGVRTRARTPRIIEENGEQLVHDIVNNTVLGYKYFAYQGNTKFTIKHRGQAQGEIAIMTVENGKVLQKITINPSLNWIEVSEIVAFPNQAGALFLKFSGKGKVDLLTITFLPKRDNNS